MNVTAGQHLAHSILQSIDTGINDVLNPINWPASAKFAVQYKLHDRKFPQVKHDREVAYFDDVYGLLRWLADKREWVKGTDYDFTMDYWVYEWDFGPVYKYNKSM